MNMRVCDWKKYNYEGRELGLDVSYTSDWIFQNARDERLKSYKHTQNISGENKYEKKEILKTIVKRKNPILKNIMMHDYFSAVPEYLLRRKDKMSINHAPKGVKLNIPAIGTLKLMF